MLDDGFETPRTPSLACELGIALLLLCLGVVLRLAFVLALPSAPISDFQNLVAFGLLLHASGATAPGWFWDFFNPGVPCALAVLFSVTPFAPDLTARLTTAVITGLTPLLPFLIWRGAVTLWARVLTGTVLAFWPGQIAFCGVVAQDNWVVIPTVALAALAVRAWRRDASSPILAGLLLAAGVATRQEMICVLPPLAWFAGTGRSVRRKDLLNLAMTAGLALGALALQRNLATGRFAIGTEHGGKTLLGAYVPGASLNGWTDPFPYLAAKAPELLDERRPTTGDAVALAWSEVRRRPLYQTSRMASMTLRALIQGEADSLYWSLSPRVLPPSRHAIAARLVDRLVPLTQATSTVILGAALAAACVAIMERDPPMLALVMSIALKVAAHFITTAQGRHFFVVTAVSVLLAVLALERALATPRRWRLYAACGLCGASAAALLAVATPPLAAAVQARDHESVRVYRFTLRATPPTARSSRAFLACVVDPGRLVALERHESATIAPVPSDPASAGLARAACILSGSPGLPLALQLRGSPSDDGSPGQIAQQVLIDGRAAFATEETQKTASGWLTFPLPPLGPGERRAVRIELIDSLRSGGGSSAATALRLFVAERGE